MDYNNDGLTDVISGDTEGSVWLFLNKGSKTKPELAKGVKLEAGGHPIGPPKDGDAGMSASGWRVMPAQPIDPKKKGAPEMIYSKIHMADWDGDGLPDLLVGQDNSVIFYKNTGTRAEPRFAPPVALSVPGGKFPMRPAPFVCDWDRDGKPDLLVGCEEAKVVFYRNVGTATKPELAAGVDLKLKAPGFSESYRTRPAVADWDNDGKPDLLVGTTCSSSDTHKTTGYVWLFKGK